LKVEEACNATREEYYKDVEVIPELEGEDGSERRGVSIKSAIEA